MGQVIELILFVLYLPSITIIITIIMKISKTKREKLQLPCPLIFYFSFSKEGGKKERE